MFDAVMSEVAHFPLTVDQLAIVGEVGEGLPVHQPHCTGNMLQLNTPNNCSNRLSRFSFPLLFYQINI